MSMSYSSNDCMERRNASREHASHLWHRNKDVALLRTVVNNSRKSFICTFEKCREAATSDSCQQDHDPLFRTDFREVRDF